ncbi:hypothetical protein ON010_g6291 [Phytophthora cinnamomi]|nr:hypothetical protein ON010_g6291 [Phytophthora cinnamomi]
MAFLADDEMAAFEAALSFVDEFAGASNAAPPLAQSAEVLNKQEMEWALSFPPAAKDSPGSSSSVASPPQNAASVSSPASNHHTTTDEDGSPRRTEQQPKRTRAPRESVQKMQGWCQDNGFEFVDLDAEQQAGDGDDDDVIDEKHGIERVLEALHCNMWRSMEMNPPKVNEAKPTEAKDAAPEVEAVETKEERAEQQSDNQVEHKDNSATGDIAGGGGDAEGQDAATDDSRLQALLQALEIAGGPDAGSADAGGGDDDDDIDMAEFSALISEVRNVRDQGQSLTDEQRQRGEPRGPVAGAAQRAQGPAGEGAAAAHGVLRRPARGPVALLRVQGGAAGHGGRRPEQGGAGAAHGLHVRARALASKDEVLVDVGTGYFVEQSAAKAEQFMDRKVEFLQSNTEQLKTVIDGKRNMLEAVLMIMQQKMQEAQRQ